MAQLLSITKDTAEIGKTLTKVLQSGNISFLMGSGASLPAISVAGNIENELNELIDKEDWIGFSERQFEFLSGIQEVTNSIIEQNNSDETNQTINCYLEFLKVIVRILNLRKTDLLPKQVSVFTTNYDLFIERASEDVPTLYLNDGFNRKPAISSKYLFEPESFFDVLYKTGNLFNYKYPVPVVNLLKLHGSLTWQEDNGKIVHRVQKMDIPEPENKDEFLEEYALILPTKNKFHKTLLDRVYYDLLRIFANSLEIENTVLFVFGFSFDDEHIFDVTKRALKNPTLLLVIFAYSETSKDSFATKFSQFENVLIIFPEAEENIDFDGLNNLLNNVIPKSDHGE